MAEIKSYTDLEQSKKLAEILPIESADYTHFGKDEDNVLTRPYFESCSSELKEWVGKDEMHPCWSLAALLIILAKIANKIDDDGSANLSSFMGQWRINMFDCPVEASDNYDNPVDACVAMIEKLHKLNLL